MDDTTATGEVREEWALRWDNPDGRPHRVVYESRRCALADRATSTDRDRLTLEHRTVVYGPWLPAPTADYAPWHYAEACVKCPAAPAAASASVESLDGRP